MAKEALWENGKGMYVAEESKWFNVIGVWYIVMLSKLDLYHKKKLTKINKCCLLAITIYAFLIKQKKSLQVIKITNGF